MNPGTTRIDLRHTQAGADFARARKQQGRAPRMSVAEMNRRAYVKRKLRGYTSNA